ncbi:GNAT family N-acetyltransferase [Photobacterium rosenbergii]|uniref:GNAT family N-acetyltransferase n=1 Tax=Photobacterium rosenbergii TaxID=294936 RepID=A0ABU3ZCS3_9GAMM|nr:GNAT family N-acetyltransferase [Photobacterium rosenbergii]MDV5167897.1 GNAT family N-acetyltransferase [Photobacterium rosenbergii]
MTNTSNHHVTHDKDNRTYFVDLVDGYQAKVSYQISGNVLTLDHSSVPDALRGQGYASIMMEAVLKVIDEEGFKVIPQCSYVVHYMGKHDEWHHLLASQ